MSHFDLDVNRKIQKDVACSTHPPTHKVVKCEFLSHENRLVQYSGDSRVA